MPLKMTRLRLMFVRMSLASAIAIVAVAPSSSQAPTSPFDPIVEVLRQELQDTRTPGAAAGACTRDDGLDHRPDHLDGVEALHEQKRRQQRMA